MAKRTTKQKLRSQADRLWFIAVFKKYGNRCELCGDTANQAHHFYPKGLYPALRYEIANGIPICMKHHFLHHHRADPSIHLLIRQSRGKAWIDKLEKKRNKQITWTVQLYNDTINKLEKLCQED